MMIYLGIAVVLALVLVVMGVLIGRATKKGKEIIIEIPPPVIPDPPPVEDKTPSDPNAYTPDTYT